MIAPKAREDWEDLKTAGLEPTIEDFDRLNCLALRLECGPETTGANWPRSGWAGDVPFYQLTFQALSWLLQYADRVEATPDTRATFWYFAQAHARTPHFFDALVTPEAIEEAVGKWAASLPVTREEVARACKYATSGFDDAEAGKRAVVGQDVRQRTNREAAQASLEKLQKRLTKACISCGATMEELFIETPSRLDELYEAYAVEHGKTLKLDEQKLLIDYKLALKEIRERLQKEKADAHG